MKTIVKLAAGLALIATTGSPLLARTYSDAIEPGENNARFIVGAGITGYQGIFEGQNGDAGMSLNVQYNGDRFFIDNDSLNWSAMQVENCSFGFTLRGNHSYLSDADNFDDNRELAGIRERDVSVDAGIWFNHTTETGRLHLSLLTDAGGKHHGHSATVSYRFDMNAGNWHVNPGVAAQWLSKDLVDHHFGVSNLETTATRTAYQGDSAISLSAGIDSRYALSEHWDFTTSAGVQWFSDGIGDSSVVARQTNYFANIGINYNF
ncbi:MAG: MipA/OmpV family protein [Pseudomonadales bacterium]|nr:MipA/OmpV family protein [Pseudomonadales bacterium]